MAVVGAGRSEVFVPDETAAPVPFSLELISDKFVVNYGFVPPRVGTVGGAVVWNAAVGGYPSASYYKHFLVRQVVVRDGGGDVIDRAGEESSVLVREEGGRVVREETNLHADERDGRIKAKSSSAQEYSQSKSR